MNKTWKNHSRHSTFETADAKRKELLEKYDKDFKVKVKFMRSENNFLVKTWTPPADKPKSNKASTKAGKPNSKAQKRALREKKAKQNKK